MAAQWHPPAGPPPLPPSFDRPGVTRKPRRAAVIVGSAMVIAVGVVAGALILKDRPGAVDGATTCQSWAEARQILRSIPTLPNGWTFATPGIDQLIKNRNAPVGTVLSLFESKIRPDPPEVAQAATDYVAAQGNQMRALTDRTYVAADGAAVDTALRRLNQACGIHDDSQPA